MSHTPHAADDNHFLMQDLQRAQAVRDAFDAATVASSRTASGAGSVFDKIVFPDLTGSGEPVNIDGLIAQADEAVKEAGPDYQDAKRTAELADALFPNPFRRFLGLEHYPSLMHQAIAHGVVQCTGCFEGLTSRVSPAMLEGLVRLDTLRQVPTSETISKIDTLIQHTPMIKAPKIQGVLDMAARLHVLSEDSETYLLNQIVQTRSLHDYTFDYENPDDIQRATVSCIDDTLNLIKAHDARLTPDSKRIATDRILEAYIRDPAIRFSVYDTMLDMSLAQSGADSLETQKVVSAYLNDLTDLPRDRHPNKTYAAPYEERLFVAKATRLVERLPRGSAVQETAARVCLTEAETKLTFKDARVLLAPVINACDPALPSHQQATQDYADRGNAKHLFGNALESFAQNFEFLRDHPKQFVKNVWANARETLNL